MNSEVIKVLLVEDNPGGSDWIYEILIGVSSLRFELQPVIQVDQVLLYPLHKSADVILLSLLLPDSQKVDTFLHLQNQIPNIAIIVLATSNNASLALNLLRVGAQDYLIQQYTDSKMLAQAICYAIERKQVEQTLRKNEIHFRTVIEKNADSIVIVDRQGYVRFVNPAGEALFGYTATELEGELFGFPIVAGESTELHIHPRNQKPIVTEMRVVEIEWAGEPVFLASLRDITERKWAELERRKLILELKEALAEVKMLSGLLPICASCKKIRNDQGYWQQVDIYISEHSDVEFSHGICPECMEKLYPDFYKKTG